VAHPIAFRTEITDVLRVGRHGKRDPVDDLQSVAFQPGQLRRVALHEAPSARGLQGLSERLVLYKHVLKNALIQILTGIVVILPLLFTWSLITESFFGIPGLGSYTIDAINSQDFAIVRAMVFLGSLLYILGLLLTDLSYTLVDPRVRLG
jgi:ABC-type microcin C transport system permease subunit YejB